MIDSTGALSAWDWPRAVRLEPIASGLINRSWAIVGAEPLGVLQWLNVRVFDPIVHEDIEAVGAHLANKGLATPRLVRTRDGALWHRDAAGDVWRCFDWLGDRTIERLERASDARSAGALVGRFHAALLDLDWSFRHTLRAFHDTPLRMTHLREALDAHRDHRLYDEVARLSDALLAAWAAWDGPRELPPRVVHGDLKISNVRFLGDDALALIDLDTLGRGTLDAELGDAFRSWCNPASEDATRATFDLALFEAGMVGYASAQGPVAPEEWDGIAPGVERIALELSARFAADALNESYFGFDPRYGRRGEHNLVRARGQHALAVAVRAARRDADAIVHRARLLA